MNPNLIILKKGHFKFLSQRKTTRENFKLWINSTFILALITIWFLWVYYVWTLNINATKWYNIRNLELQKQNLTVEKELLEVKIAELQSLTTLLNWEWAKQMTKSNNHEFYVLKEAKTYALKN